MLTAVLKKYSVVFVKKKLTLQYEPACTSVVTDEKWLAFIIGQVISNALKYTNSGSISIYMEEEQKLVIEDTGIGIKTEDIPRVFERGYTGYNGRNDKKSTGIGLYLCASVAKKLGHTMSIESEIGRGTKVTIDLKNHNGIVE
jgi:signal transduction histidine kinase